MPPLSIASAFLARGARMGLPGRGKPGPSCVGKIGADALLVSHQSAYEARALKLLSPVSCWAVGVARDVTSASPEPGRSSLLANTGQVRVRMSEPVTALLTSRLSLPVLVHLCPTHHQDVLYKARLSSNMLRAPPLNLPVSPTPLTACELATPNLRSHVAMSVARMADSSLWHSEPASRIVRP